MWTTWPAVSPESPATRAARIGYLLASPGERAELVEQTEAQGAADRAERAHRAVREAEAEETRARDEILSLGVFREDFLPKVVYRGVRFRAYADAPGLMSVWHHRQHGLTIRSGRPDLNPGPGWTFGHAAEHDRAFITVGGPIEL